MVCILLQLIALYAWYLSGEGQWVGLYPRNFEPCATDSWAFLSYKKNYVGLCSLTIYISELVCQDNKLNKV